MSENNNNVEKRKSAAQNRKPGSVFIKRLFFIAILAALGCGVFFPLKAYFDEVSRERREKQLIEESRDIYKSAVEEYSTPDTAVTDVPTQKPSYVPRTGLFDAEKKIRPEFVKLMEEYDNRDIVGYVNIPGTTVDYPVLQSEDNAYYLNRDINKNYTSAGWIFLDYENNIEKDDWNTIIYGHNMRADVMFHSLRYYTDPDYFKEHPYVTFNTLYEEYTWEIFSFYKTDTDFYYIQAIFRDYNEFFRLAKEMKSRSMYDTGVELKYGDRVLTLSTCTGESGKDTRFVVNARLIKVNKIDPPPIEGLDQ